MRRRHAGVRHRDDQVGGNAATRAQAAGPSPRATSAPSGRRSSSPAAQSRHARRCSSPAWCVGVEVAAGHAVFRDHHQLARLHVALVLRMQQVEGAGLGGEDKGVRSAVHAGDPAHRQRPEAMRIARGEDAVARHHHDRERALHLRAASRRCSPPASTASSARSAG